MTVTPAPTATATEFAPLTIGPMQVWPPVVLAPMAGITNAPFRTLCREQSGGRGQQAPDAAGAASRADDSRPASLSSVAAAPLLLPPPPSQTRPSTRSSSHPGSIRGLYVSEMITTRALVERNAKTMQLIKFDASEKPRSIQLYGVDPATVGKAARMIAEEGLADHIDLNFGCPVPKVTRKGGGSALPYKRNLLREILREAVANAGDLPVTMKMRKGIDDDHLTYLDAGRIGAEEGVSAIALHGRTAAQHYGGTADWSAIARLRESVPAHIPVLGNGDIWSADDAVRMMRETGCDGVVVGRGCLGRPWLFKDLVAIFEGEVDHARPSFADVARAMVRHAQLLGEWLEDETRGVIDFRKHVAWYTKGFSVGSELRVKLANSSSLAELAGTLAQVEQSQLWPAGADGPRGRTSGNNRVVLPEGWLDDPYDCALPSADAESDSSGG